MKLDSRSSYSERARAKKAAALKALAEVEVVVEDKEEEKIESSDEEE
jgi:hypothetical protein